MTLASLRIDGDRLWASLMAMAEIGATPGGGSNRLALSEEDGAARRLLAACCEDAGAPVSVDAVGNMVARRAGTDAGLPPVMAGSHLDTQPMGGRFDGVLGVLAALEVLRTLRDAGILTRHPVEFVNWTNEEGARFAPAMTGSRAFTGLDPVDIALGPKDSAGISVGDALRRIGFAGGAAPGHPVAAYFELHIEQGPILEDGGFDIGVVTHAQGVRWLDVTVTGTAGHAGTTPMAGRHDALLGAARLIEAVNQTAAAFGAPAVATVGQLRVEPGSRNAIPGRVKFSIDARHPDETTLEGLAGELKARIAADAAAAGLGVVVEDVLAFAPTSFDESCVAAVRNAADSCGYRHRDIVSGGGHDACNIARVAPTAMIFCPCVGGVSHTEAENIKPEWAEAGANVLLHAVLAKAGRGG